MIHLYIFSYEEINRHLMSHDRDITETNIQTSKSLRCPILECDMILSGPEFLKKHINGDHKIGPYFCCHCGKTYQSRQKFIIHFNYHFHDESQGIQNQATTETTDSFGTDNLPVDSIIECEISDSDLLPTNDSYADLVNDLNHFYSIKNIPASTLNSVLACFQKHLKTSNESLLNELSGEITDPTKKII